MSISNKVDSFDIRIDVFRFINDTDKTRVFIDEVLRGENTLKDCYVFYNFKDDFFTIHPKVGKTIFIAYLQYDEFKSIVESDVLNHDIVYSKLHELFVNRVKKYKDDLLRFHFDDGDLASSPDFDTVFLKRHGLGLVYHPEIKGFKLLEDLSHESLYAIINYYHIKFLQDVNKFDHIDTLDLNKFEIIFSDYARHQLCATDYFLNFKKDLFAKLKSNFINSHFSSKYNIYLDDNVIRKALLELEKEIGYERFSECLEKHSYADRNKISRILPNLALAC